MLTDMHYTWRRRIYRFACWEFLHRFWTKIYVEGWENIPRDQPTLIISNHVGAFDPVVMISFYPDRDIVPLAKKEAFREPLVGVLSHHWGAIPVQRGEGDLNAMKSMIRHINDGDVGMFYIEGTRSKTGLIKGQEGAAFIALKTNAVVVPMGIWGSRTLFKSWGKDFERVPIYCRFGKPFRFKHEGRRLPRDKFTPMTTEAMYRISDLLPERWRGIYSDLSQASSEHLDFDVDFEPVRSPLSKRVAPYIPEEAYK